MNGSFGEHPIEEAIRIVGGRWRAVLVHCLLGGPKRFSDLQREVPAISRRLLTVELRRLEEARIISRTVYAEVPVRVEYQLTKCGQELRTVIGDLYSWGQKRINCQREKASAVSLLPVE